MKEKSLSTKLGSHCGDGCDEARQTPSKTLDYNRTDGRPGGSLPRAKTDRLFKALLVLAIAVTAFIANGSAYGTDIQWLGTTSNDYGVGSNWNGGTIPTASDNALFNTTFTNQPNLTSTSRSVDGLWMTTGVMQNVTLSASPGFALTIIGTGTINGTANTGILMDNTSAFTWTISAPLVSKNDQFWTNNSGNQLTISGAVDTNKSTITLNGSGTHSLISGAIGTSTGGAIVKSGTGTWKLTGANTYGTSASVTATTVNAGTLLVDNTTGSGTGKGRVVVNSGGTLGGTGSISGNVVVNSGGNLAPGNSPGIITTGGTVTLASGSNFNIEINGPTVGTQYDQLNATGNNAVTITGSNLVVTVGGTLAVGEQFIIINKDGTTGVVGTFAGLAEGATFTSGGDTFQITYAGGTGNDVVLTATVATPEPSTWIGGAIAVAALAYTQRRRFAHLLRKA